MLLGCFFLQAAAKAKATMSASLMRRWATVQKTKLNSACNAATQVNAAQPLLDLACGEMSPRICRREGGTTTAALRCGTESGVELQVVCSAHYVFQLVNLSLIHI